MMPSAYLDPFLELVAKSGLLALDRLALATPTAGEPADLAAQLMAEGLLTPYQARLLLNGWYRGFFVADKYKILDVLGEGGMGRVYLCEQLVLQRLVAVKQLQIGSEAIPGAAERFLREAVAVAALDHPNIARIHDADRTQDGAYLVMESIDGVNLHQLTAKLGRLPVARAAGLIRQAALGLQHAHERGLVHRDIKPGNLMVDRSGTVKILDLGLARFFDASRNHDLTNRFDSRRALGTAEFMSPEQAINSSEVDTRADIYSLGGTLYFLLLGRFPYEDGTALEKLQRHQAEPFDPVGPQRPDVPAGLIAVLDKMVAKNPHQRYPDPAAAAAALEPFATPPEPLSNDEHVMPPSYRLGLSPSPSDSVVGGAASTPMRGVARLSTIVTPMPRERPTPVSPLFPPTEALPFAESGESALVPVGPPLGSPRRGRRAGVALAGMMLAAALAAGAVLGSWRSQAIVSGRGVEIPPPEPAAAVPAAIAISGSGSTLAQPLFGVWVTPGVSYTGTGSSRGVRQMIEQVVDFAATDVPLTDDQIESARRVNGPVQHVPVVLSAAAVSHTVPGVAAPLRFTGPLLAEIYLGHVKRWDDPALQANNPGVALPNLPIVVIRRSDGSGTTAIFTDYLSRVSAAFNDQVGPGAEPTWPVGIDNALAAKGNDGVARTLSRTAGAIGYLDATHAIAAGLPLALVQNRGGEYVGPTREGVTAAMRAREAEVPPDLRFSLADTPGDEVYPIAGAVYVVAYRKQPSAKVGPLRDYLRYALQQGPGPLESLGYAPLPEGIRVKAIAAVATLGN